MLCGLSFLIKIKKQFTAFKVLLKLFVVQQGAHTINF